MSRKPSALELVQSVTALPGYTSACGTEVVHAEPGTVHLRVRRRPDLLQFNGFFHGGVIAGLADYAAGAAVSTALPEDKITVTIDLQVNFVAPAQGNHLLARASAVQIGSTIAVARVDVVCDSSEGERLCSIATATLRVVSRAPSA